MQDSPTCQLCIIRLEFNQFGSDLQLALRGVMKRINVSFNEEKEAVILDGLRQLLGKESIYSVSDGLNILVRKIAHNEDGFDVPESNIEHQKAHEQKAQKNVNLTPELVADLEQASKRHCWSFSREVRFRLNHTLNDNFDLFDPELREFNLCRHSINRVGRNLRNILVENQNVISDKSLFSFDVNELRTEIKALNKKIDNYVALCGKRNISSKIKEMFKDPVSAIKEINS